MAVELHNLPGQITRLVSLGQSKFDNCDYAEASTLYHQLSDRLTQGLYESLCLEAHALQFTGNLDEALSIARKASALFPEGMARCSEGRILLQMRKFAEARSCFVSAKNAAKRQGDKDICEEWMMTCDTAEKAEKESTEMEVGKGNVGQEDGTAGKAEREKGLPDPSVKISWYQNDAMITLDVYVKKAAKDMSEVVFERKMVKIRLKRDDGKHYVRNVEVFDEIVPEECSWSTSKFKAEIHLKKANPGVHWEGLDQEEAEKATEEAEARAKRIAQMRERKREAWDEIIEKEQVDKEVYGDPALQTLKSIYADSDENVRKAMVKSFTESGGRVLSTDWNDVKGKKVEYNEKKYE